MPYPYLKKSSSEYYSWYDPEDIDNRLRGLQDLSPRHQEHRNSAYYEESTPTNQRSREREGSFQNAVPRLSQDDDIDLEAAVSRHETSSPGPRPTWEENKHVHPTKDSVEDEVTRNSPLLSVNVQEGILVHVYTICWLIFFSLLGTLGRIGIEWITFYPDMPVTTNVLWANFTGTFFLGFLQEDRVLFANRESHTPQSNTPPEQNSQPHRRRKRTYCNNSSIRMVELDHLAMKRTIPLHIGLTVGFCGTITSFSSFMRDLFLAISNDLVPASTSTNIPARNPGWSVPAFLAVAITEIAICITALRFGAHCAIFLSPLLSKLPNTNPARWLNPLSIILGPGCWLGAVFLCVWPPENHWRGDVLFSLAFAPLGCLLRFFISLRLNPLTSFFPLGTFTANILGTAVLAVAFVLQRSRLQPAGGAIGGGRLGCQFFEGVLEGFCGAVTTVSTWVAELRALERRWAYVYGVASVGIGLGLLIAVVGGVRWGIGFAGSVCSG